jgi:hypothetical protein
MNMASIVVRSLREIGNNKNEWNDHVAIEDTSFTLIERNKYYAYLGLKLVLLHSTSHNDMLKKANSVCNGLKHINIRDDNLERKAKKHGQYTQRKANNKR